MTEIVGLTEAHWPAVRQIYALGIAGGNATFAAEPPTWDGFADSHLMQHAVVAVDDGAGVGWVAVSPVSGRKVYAGVVEHSVYVHPDATGTGIGTALMRWLIASTE